MKNCCYPKVRGQNLNHKEKAVFRGHRQAAMGRTLAREVLVFTAIV